MDFSISEEQQTIRELASQILGDRCTDDYQNEFDRSSEAFDRTLWKQLAESNLLGTALPEDVDGMGMGMRELSELLEEQGRVLAHVPLIPVLVQAALPVAEFGSSEQRQALLPGLISGSLWITGALQEANADAAAPETTARAADGGHRLNGEKVAVAVADGAHRLVVSARLEDGSTGLFLVDPAGPGIELAAGTSTTGRPAYRVALSSATGELLSGERVGEALAWTLQRARTALAAVTLGVASEALRRTAEYVSNRKQFGKPIGTFQGVALRSADGYIDLECMRTTLWQALYSLDVGRDAACEVAVAKWWSCRGGQRVVHSAQHLHGGIGVDTEYPIHRYFLWAKALELELGGASQNRRDLGRLLATP
jgi:alkylation response protein AidB-like acyl-CoA dehydrogenase